MVCQNILCVVANGIKAGWKKHVHDASEDPGVSRISARLPTAIEQAAERVNMAIDNHTVGNLEYRHVT